MTVTNDFLPFATGSGANVVSPATWATTTSRFTGFQSGTASSAQVNMAIRQAGFVSAMIAQFIADTLAQNVADNGNLATLEAQFISAIQTSVGSPAQAAFWHFGHDTGPVNVMQVAAAPIITAVADGMVVATLPHFSNTISNPTLSANGLAAAVIVHVDGTALNPGDISINTVLIVEYDAGGSVWRIIGQSAVPQAALNHYGADVGTKNAMLVSTVTPGIAAVTTGMKFDITKGAAGNDAATTLNIAGTLAALTWADGTPFTGGEWPASADGTVLYEGHYRLMSITTPFAFIVPGTPVPLLAPRTYFVNGTTGSDANTGLASGSAFATIQKAITTTQSLNMNGFNVLINVATGNYAPIICGALNGSGTVTIQGDLTTPTNVLIHATTGEAAEVQAPGYNLLGLAFQADANGAAPHQGAGIRTSSNVFIQNLSFGACSAAHFFLDPGGQVTCAGTGNGFPTAFINVTGNSPRHIFGAGVMQVSQTILNFSGTLTFTTVVDMANLGLWLGPYSVINVTGSVTGKRYSATANAIINTVGAGVIYFPGTVAGTTATGGQYI